MIDSLNLIIWIRYLNFQHLKDLGINIKYFSDVDISFEYKNIEFKYNSIKKYLLIIAPPHKILGKTVIKLTDKELYKTKISGIIREILPTERILIEVNRIDYFVDIPVGEKIEEYCTLLNRHSGRYHYMKQRKVYETSIYLTNINGQTHLNFYNRYKKTKNIFDLGILRLEVQNKPPKIKSEYIKNYNETPKSIDYYWSKVAMEKYYFEFLTPYLFLGDYYKRKQGKQSVDKANRKESERKRLNRFLLIEEKYGIDELVKKKVLCYNTMRKYIQILNELGINPITIPKECEYEHLDNLLKIARRISEDKYFK